VDGSWDWKVETPFLDGEQYEAVIRAKDPTSGLWGDNSATTMFENTSPKLTIDRFRMTPEGIAIAGEAIDIDTPTITVSIMVSVDGDEWISLNADASEWSAYLDENFFDGQSHQIVATAFDTYYRGLVTEITLDMNGGSVPVTGDANGDGQFDSADLIEAFQAGEYEDQISGNSTWNEGDWNGDGEFSTGDLVVAFQSGQYADAVDAVMRRVL
jgi:hypothetical protein